MQWMSWPQPVENNSRRVLKGSRLQSHQKWYKLCACAFALTVLLKEGCRGEGYLLNDLMTSLDTFPSLVPES